MAVNNSDDALRPQEDPYKLMILGEDIRRAYATAIDFFFANGELSVSVMKMACCECSHMTQAEYPDSRGGQHLMCQTEFHCRKEFRTSRITTLIARHLHSRLLMKMPSGGYNFFRVSCDGISIKAETDVHVDRQAKTMKQVRIRDMDNSDEGWAVVEVDDSECEVGEDNDVAGMKRACSRPSLLSSWESVNQTPPPLLHLSSGSHPFVQPRTSDIAPRAPMTRLANLSSAPLFSGPSTDRE
ncbi:hypothetical protein PAXINDRAFT_103766 [Paxillus involutus ATCC 200175]|uniref:Uncharacterized protein n=1 Tax=Paxillus involutus ATCC 200175 TaxID=664439 RepID=A0A0C9SM36_PAXIN|nr:hypothetical protein PAXINDRAFT_103766 [Paxillus involutus ATCC 200175]